MSGGIESRFFSINTRSLRINLIKKLKFASTSIIATVVDLSVYAIFIYIIFQSEISSSSTPELVIATIFGALTGMVVNFFLLKRYVFSLNRTVSKAFVLSIIVSLGAILLEALIVFLLAQFSLFHSSPIMKMFPKIIAMIIIFFYTYFFLKRVFEKG